MITPDYEIVFNNQTSNGRLCRFIGNPRHFFKWLSAKFLNYWKEKAQLKDFLPDSLIKENHLMNLQDAVEKIHFPDNLDEAETARERLAFDELFDIQTGAIVRKKPGENVH